MMTDPIADMLTRIRNAAWRGTTAPTCPRAGSRKPWPASSRARASSPTCAPARANGPQKLTIVLKYGRDRQSAIDGVRRVSRPGRRVYVRHDRIPRVLSGLGISILSTSRGLMSDREARRQKLGGELICEVW